MATELQKAITDLRTEISKLPPAERERIVAAVKRIQALAGEDVSSSSKLMAAGCPCGPQGEPGIVPIW